MAPRLNQDTSNSNKQLFKCPHNAGNISRNLHSFYETQKFFDIILVSGVDGVELPTHRIVLSAASGFFLGMFSSTFQEATSNKVTLQEIDGATMRKIIEFMYTSEMELDRETVRTVLKAADFLDMKTLVDACCEYLAEELDQSNCICLWQYADLHNYTVLYKKALRFACENFEHIYTEDKFFLLTEEQISKYLSSTDLVTSSEEHVFHSVEAWVEFDRANREKCLSNLLSHVKFELLSPKFIVSNRDLICQSKSSECYELICSWLEWHLSSEIRPNLAINTKARKIKQTLAVLETENDFNMYTLNQETNTWECERLFPPPETRMDYSLIVINKKLILIGGTLNNYPTNTVEYFDYEIKDWIELPPMRYARRRPCVTELYGELYVVGGVDEKFVVEKFNFHTEQWQVIDNSISFVSLVASDRHIYAMGEEDEIYYYNPVAVSNKWISIAKNDHLGIYDITVVDGHLYAVGYDGMKNKKTVERYNHSTDTWSFASCITPTSSIGSCLALNDRLIYCGWLQGSILKNPIHEYDPKLNQWSCLASLPSEISNHELRLFTFQ